jgi:hypothetical protein
MPSSLVSGQTYPQRRGAPIRAADLNRIADGAWLNGTQFGSGFAGGRFPGGSFIYPIPAPPGSGTPAATIFPPWYPYLTQSSGNYQANFYPGTFAGLLVTGWNTPLALTQNAVNYIYLAVTATAGNITGATLTASTTYPTLASANSGSPPASFNVPIAVVDLTVATPKIYNMVGFGNIWAQPQAVLFDTINTGQLLTAPFTVWYNWVWGAGQD